MQRLTLLTKQLKKSTGRNNQGRITVHHRGGGHKRLYRIIDFKRSLFDVPGIVKRIDYDPNRNAKLALINYKNGILSYIVAPIGLLPGDKICAGTNVDITTGNALPLESIPVGTFIHNIESKPGHGAQLMRSAGTYAKLIKKDPKTASVLIRLHSGKLCQLSKKVMATIGIVSNETHKNLRLRKAGQSRWNNRRPTVRGVAMNPIDHPHGGGQGKAKGGGHPVSPWGKLTKGKATSFRRLSTKQKLYKNKHSI